VLLYGSITIREGQNGIEGAEGTIWLCTGIRSRRLEKVV
jgi:hypothetical protein